MEWYRQEIAQCTYRQFTTGFYFGKPNENTQIYDNSTYISESVYLGIVEEKRDHLIRIEQKNKFSVGETVEIMKPSGENVSAVVEGISDSEGREQESAPHARQKLWVRLSRSPEKMDILRRLDT